MIKKLEWDSNFFGFNIAELNTSDFDCMEDISDFIELNNIAFIQARCNIEDLKKISQLERSAFHYADLKVTYQMKIHNGESFSSISSFATTEDIEPLQTIASSSFIDSRYYGHENIFPKENIDKLYQVWVEKSVQGLFDDFCLKIVVDGEIAGFITAKIKANTAVIGIIAVKDRYQSQGIGTQLLESLLKLLYVKNVENIEVSTQGKNIKAQNFYIKNGFRLKTTESWYYWWRGAQ